MEQGLASIEKKTIRMTGIKHVINGLYEHRSVQYSRYDWEYGKGSGVDVGPGPTETETWPR